MEDIDSTTTTDADIAEGPPPTPAESAEVPAPAPVPATPPKLKREIRIPVLQIEKLQQIPPPPHSSGGKSSSKTDSTNLERTDADASPAISPSATTPPQLEPALVGKDEDNSPESMELSDQDGTDAPAPEELIVLGRRERRCSSVSITDIDQKSNTSVSATTKARRKANEPVRKIIQSIFAKPKPQKPRRSRRGKGKPSPKKSASKPARGHQVSTILKIKIPSASSRRLRKAEEEKAALLKTETEAATPERFEFEGDEYKDNADEPEERYRDSRVRADEDDDDEGSIVEELARTDKMGVKIKNELEDDDEDTSKKSEEDDEDMFDEIDQDDWKPVRAAMVAAMELVAKKQVTEDMRVERRVRKPNLKPLPPKGRGRRTIFKKMQKPVPSCQETEGPTVESTVYYNRKYYQKGDIVYLLPPRFLEAETSSSSGSDEESSEEEFEIEPNIRRFFQIRGFLRTSMTEVVASVIQLKAKPNRCSESPFPFDPSMFAPDYRKGETMVKMNQLKFVLHCPIDLYQGHVVSYNNLVPGSFYARLGCQFYAHEQTVKPVKNHPDSTDDSSTLNKNHSADTNKIDKTETSSNATDSAPTSQPEVST